MSTSNVRAPLLCGVSAAVVGLLCWSPSFAADRVAPRPIVAAPIVVNPIWAGFYFGADAGYGWSKFSYDRNAEDGSDLTGSDGKGNPALKGLNLGLHAGYNWQHSQWVLGIEGDASFDPARSTIGTTTTLTRQTDWLASIRARLGMTFDHSLVYATGGVAWSGGTTSLLTNTGGHNVANSYVATGAVWGGGIEWKKTSTVSVRLEALQYVFNTTNTVVSPNDTYKDKLNTQTVVRLGVSVQLR